MLSCPSFRSVFVFSINSSILSDLPLIFIHLSFFNSFLVALYSYMCSYPKNRVFIYNYSHFSGTHFAINLFYFTTGKRK